VRSINKEALILVVLAALIIILLAVAESGDTTPRTLAILLTSGDTYKKPYSTIVSIFLWLRRSRRRSRSRSRSSGYFRSTLKRLSISQRPITINCLD